jgi:ssRNA-specific RNase YbeY (16S rRNA maturation enzyme)
MSKSIQTFINSKKQTCTDHNELKQLIQAHKNVEFAINMSRHHSYDIPLVIDDDITNVHLTIINKNAKTNNISIKYSSDICGETNAEFTIKDNSLDGFIISDNKEMTDTLKANSKTLKESLGDIGIDTLNITYGTKKALNYKYSFNDNYKGEHLSNKKLYSISKMLISNMKQAQKELTKV